jgi:pilus assembly protein Flp/PilA
MSVFASRVRRFLVSEDGPTAVEYAVMLALIVVACIAAVRLIGTNATTTFNGAANAMSGTS